MLYTCEQRRLVVELLEAAARLHGLDQRFLVQAEVEVLGVDLVDFASVEPALAEAVVLDGLVDAGLDRFEVLVLEEAFVDGEHLVVVVEERAVCGVQEDCVACVLLVGVSRAVAR